MDLLALKLCGKEGRPQRPDICGHTAWPQESRSKQLAKTTIFIFQTAFASFNFLTDLFMNFFIAQVVTIIHNVKVDCCLSTNLQQNCTNKC